MWTAELEAPLLTVAHDAGVTAVGLMSGGLAVFDEAGARFGVDGLEEPYSVTAYGTAVHRATGSIAAVVGPADPAVMVFEAFDRTYAPSLRIGMLDNRWEPTVLEFSSDGRYVLFEDGGVRIVNVETAEEATAALALNVVRVRPVGPDGVFAALGAGGPSDPRHGFRPPAEFTLFDRAGTVPVRQRFWSSEPGLTIAEGRFVLTDGSRLYCFELTGL
jgi:hypothetical protein